MCREDALGRNDKGEPSDAGAPAPRRRPGGSATRLPTLEALEPRRLLNAATVPYGATYRDTAEFMLGRVAVNVVLLESDGRVDPDSEQWTGAEIEHVKGAIRQGVQWWQDTFRARFPDSTPALEFVVDWTHLQTPVPTAFEPVRRQYRDERLWVDDFLDDIGADTPADHLTDMFRYNHAQRIALDTHWAYTVFVADSSADRDGRFADGFFAYAHHGGPYLVMTYDNGPWGAEQMAQVFAHETGHIFHALDEFEGGDSFHDVGGYLAARNTNAARHQPHPDRRVPSLFAEPSLQALAYGEHTSSPGSLEMIGWRDTDADGIPDVLDVPLMLSGSGTYDGADGVYRFQGTSRVGALPNLNPDGTGHAHTLNRIQALEYRLDGEDWHRIELDGGYVTDLSVAIPAGSPGTHAIDLRTVADTGVLSSVVADAFVAEPGHAPPPPEAGPTPGATVFGGARGGEWALAMPDGGTARVVLRGPGRGAVRIDPAQGLTIDVHDTTARSALTVRLDGASPHLGLHRLTVHGSLRQIDIRAIGLDGDLIVTGGLGRLQAGDTIGPSRIEIGTSDTRPQMPSTIHMGRIQGLSLSTRSPIRSLSALSWHGAGSGASIVEAPSLGALRVRGDFEADLRLAGGVGHRDGLQSAAIGGRVADARWSIGGAVRSIAIAGEVAAWHLVGPSAVRVLRLGIVRSAEVLLGEGDGSGRIAMLTAERWEAGRIVAGSAGTVVIAGSRDGAGSRAGLGADITLTNRADRYALRRLVVRGALDGATIRSAGRVETVTVDAMRGARFYSGADASPDDGTPSLDAIAPQGTVDRFIIRGPISNSTIAAWSIGRLRTASGAANSGGLMLSIVENG